MQRYAKENKEDARRAQTTSNQLKGPRENSISQTTIASRPLITRLPYPTCPAFSYPPPKLHQPA